MADDPCLPNSISADDLGYRIALLSLRPKFVDALLNGTKTVEFRKAAARIRCHTSVKGNAHTTSCGATRGRLEPPRSSKKHAPWASFDPRPRVLRFSLFAV